MFDFFKRPYTTPLICETLPTNECKIEHRLFEANILTKNSDTLLVSSNLTKPLRIDNCICFDLSKKLVLVQFENKDVALINLPKGRLYKYSINSRLVGFYTKGNYIYLSSEDGTVNIVRKNEQKVHKTFHTPLHFRGTANWFSYVHGNKVSTHMDWNESIGTWTLDKKVLSNMWQIINILVLGKTIFYVTLLNKMCIYFGKSKYVLNVQISGNPIIAMYYHKDTKQMVISIQNHMSQVVVFDLSNGDLKLKLHYYVDDVFMDKDGLLLLIDDSRKCTNVLGSFLGNVQKLPNRLVRYNFKEKETTTEFKKISLGSSHIVKRVSTI